MAYDLEEQEQLDELKTWWKLNGKFCIALIVGALLVYATMQAWTYYQHKKSIDASTQYQELLVADSKDLKNISAKTNTLLEQFATTPYAGRAALYAAKLNYQAKENKAAKTQLEWAMQHAQETSVSALAGLQLANLLAEEKDYEAALKILDAKHDSGFDGLYLDLKGDILITQGKHVDAKAAYLSALSKLDPLGKYHLITQQKLEALG